MEREDGRRAEILDRYWDAVLRGGSPARPDDVDDVAAAVVAHLAGRQDAPVDEAARERTRLRILALAQTQIMEASMMTHQYIHPVVMPGSAGALHQPRRDRPRWAATQLATAALLILTMVMSLVALGGRQSGGPEPPLSHLAAPSAQPPAVSIPEASPRASSALAEFVAEIRLGAGPSSTPTGMAVGVDGTLYAIDAIQDQIRLFAPDGQPIDTWGEAGEQLGQYKFHEGGAFRGDLAFGPDGNLYVLDTFNSRIQVLRPDNTVVRAWGEAGSGEGQFTLPGGIAVDGAGRVYVADTENRRVQIFDANGQFLETWATSEDGGRWLSPNDVAVDPAGIVSVTDGTTKQVIRFDADGAVIGAFGGDGSGPERLGDPVGVISDAQGNLFVADGVGSRIQVFAPDGTLLGTIGGAGVQPGQFITPAYLALGPDGLLYVAEEGNRRIQVFRLRSLADTEREIVTETLIDVADVALPAAHAQLYAMVTELQLVHDQATH